MARTRRAAPSQSSSASAPPPARSPPSAQHQNQHTHQASTTPQPQVTNIYVQRGTPAVGGGGGSGLLGTVASVAAGSVIGHGISHMLFNREQPPTQPAQAQEMARQLGDGACSPQIQSYSKCLEANAENATNCRWAWDHFMQCQEKQPQS